VSRWATGSRSTVIAWTVLDAGQQRDARDHDDVGTREQQRVIAQVLAR